MKQLLTSKPVVLLMVVLLLSLGLGHIRGMITDREHYRDEAFASIQQGLAGKQSLIGPVLVRDCTEQPADKAKEHDSKSAEARTHTQLLLPETLNAQGQAGIEPRYRGIFRINSFTVKGELVGKWAETSATLPGEKKLTTCSAFQVGMAVEDPRGIRSATLLANGQPLRLLPGSGLRGNTRGFHAELPAALHGRSLELRLQLEFVGLERLALVPVADETSLRLKSDWAHPSFVGNFLPLERQVTAQGFDAFWKVPALASSVQGMVANGPALCSKGGLGARGMNDVMAEEKNCLEAFGVSFMEPVDHYALGDRASKYGLIFIVLTFVGVWLMEILKSLRVHQLQYLLTGAALAVFFLLLASLSEHMAFGLAYLLATLACVALLTYYARFMLRDWQRGGLFGLAVSALYGLLYLLLQLEQTAFLVGSLVMFAALALLMIVTRKVDWYALAAETARRPDHMASPVAASPDSAPVRQDLKAMKRP